MFGDEDSLEIMLDSTQRGTLKVNGFLREAITISRLRNTNVNRLLIYYYT